MARKSNTPTRKDVADLAGVSETIVSYVLNANRYVSADKKKRVLEAVEKLHYRPNSIARALKGKGIRAVIAPYFGDIFNNNCFQNGLLPVALPIHEIEQLADEMKASPGNARITVDLENCQVISPTGRTIPFQVDARRQHAMLNGLDDIAQTMAQGDVIAAWQAKDKTARPWVWL